MKLLFITNYPSPYRVDFFNLLGKECSVTVLFENGIEEITHRDQKWFNSKFTDFEAIFLKRTKLFKGKSICFNVTSFLNNSFDLIIVCNYSKLTGMYAINYMNRKGIKFAIEADGAQRKNGKGFKEKLKKLLISSASWWFSTSKETDDYFIYYGANKTNIFRYPFTSLLKEEILNHVVSENDKNLIKDELGIRENKVILSVGRLIHSKGFDVLFNACKNIPTNIAIYIIGGKPPESFRDELIKLGISNIHFIDFKPKAELRKFFMASDLFVLPTRGDVWGLVINEAMAYGLPVITTNKCVAGLELIDDGVNGYIVPSGDADQLRNRIVYIMEDNTLMDNMGRENLKKIREYSIENMVRAHIEICKKIIKIY